MGVQGGGPAAMWQGRAGVEPGKCGRVREAGQRVERRLKENVWSK